MESYEELKSEMEQLENRWLREGRRNEWLAKS
jgi:hypothetical protein